MIIDLNIVLNSYSLLQKCLDNPSAIVALLSLFAIIWLKGPADGVAPEGIRATDVTNVVTLS